VSAISDELHRTRGDGNETSGARGGGLFAASAAYAISCRHVVISLCSLVFRAWLRIPLARSGAPGLLGRGIHIGSLTAAIAQGITLGAVLQGIRVADKAYAADGSTG